MSHGNAVIHRNRVELGGVAAEFLDFFLDQLTGLMQMGVTRNELGEAIPGGSDRMTSYTLLYNI